jgi:hypothetical protein
LRFSRFARVENHNFGNAAFVYRTTCHENRSVSFLGENTRFKKKRRKIPAGVLRNRDRKIKLRVALSQDLSKIFKNRKVTPSGTSRTTTAPNLVEIKLRLRIYFNRNLKTLLFDKTQNLKRTKIKIIKSKLEQKRTKSLSQKLMSFRE